MYATLWYTVFCINLGNYISVCQGFLGGLPIRGTRRRSGARSADRGPQERRIGLLCAIPLHRAFKCGVYYIKKRFKPYSHWQTDRDSLSVFQADPMGPSIVLYVLVDVQRTCVCWHLLPFDSILSDGWRSLPNLPRGSDQMTVGWKWTGGRFSIRQPHREEQAVFVLSLHQRSRHGPIILLLSGDQRTDFLLSMRIHWQTPPVWKEHSSPFNLLFLPLVMSLEGLASTCGLMLIVWQQISLTAF